MICVVLAECYRLALLPADEVTGSIDRFAVVLDVGFDIGLHLLVGQDQAAIDGNGRQCQLACRQVPNQYVIGRLLIGKQRALLPGREAAGQSFTFGGFQRIAAPGLWMYPPIWERQRVDARQLHGWINQQGGVLWHLP